MSWREEAADALASAAIAVVAPGDDAFASICVATAQAIALISIAETLEKMEAHR